MDLRSELSHVSKHKIDILVDMAIEDEAILSELMDVALSDEDPICWYAAWAVNHMALKDSKVLIPYVAQMGEKIGNSENESQIGRLLKALAETDFVLEDNACIVDSCYAFLGQGRPQFVKVYAMLLLKKIVKIEPALGRETVLVLENCMPFLGRDYLVRKARDLISYIEKIEDSP